MSRYKKTRWSCVPAWLTEFLRWYADPDDALHMAAVAGNVISLSWAVGAPIKVNYQMLIQQHPDMAKVQTAMQAESEAAKKEFDAKAASLGEKEKQEYFMQLQQRLQLKNQELMVPIFNKVDAVIKEVSDAKGLAIVVDAAAVIYGGADITDECVKKITGK